MKQQLRKPRKVSNQYYTYFIYLFRKIDASLKHNKASLRKKLRPKIRNDFGKKLLGPFVSRMRDENKSKQIASVTNERLRNKVASKASLVSYFMISTFSHSFSILCRIVIETPSNVAAPESLSTKPNYIEPIRQRA